MPRRKGELDPRAILRYVAKIEENIRLEVYRGSYDLLSTMNIKGADAYKKAESSNYQHYLMWEEVFATTYGHAPAPPYGAVKVPMKLEKKVEVAQWLKEMEDQVVAGKIKSWMESCGKTTITTLMLPEQVLGTTGIPKEIISAVDIRPLIAQTMEAFYLILEAIGLYFKNADHTRLVSDERWLLKDEWPLPELEIDHLG